MSSKLGMLQTETGQKRDTGYLLRRDIWLAALAEQGIALKTGYG